MKKVLFNFAMSTLIAATFIAVTPNDTMAATTGFNVKPGSTRWGGSTTSNKSTSVLLIGTEGKTGQYMRVTLSYYKKDNGDLIISNYTVSSGTGKSKLTEIRILSNTLVRISYNNAMGDARYMQVT